MVYILLIAAATAILVFVLFRKSSKTGRSLADVVAERVKHLVSNEVECAYFADVVDWFKKRKEVKDLNPESIAFSLLKKRGDGKYEVVIGIFNKNTGELLDGEKLIALRIDPELEKAHNGKELVIYE